MRLSLPEKVRKYGLAVAGYAFWMLLLQNQYKNRKKLDMAQEKTQ